MIKHYPEMEYFINKTTSTIATTIDFNAALFAKSLEYFNDVTDKMFYAYTVKVADSLNNVSDYAKENIQKSTKQIVDLLGDRK
jgi:predicted DNA-binding protein (UPF0278 family)